MSNIIKIVSRWDSSNVLFEHPTTDERQASGLAVRDALEAACKAGANLAGANLAGADLARANLAGADLARANLAWADLDGANLAGADLARANLAGADLAGAYLAGACLDGANLVGANGEKLFLVGQRPVLQIGPIGSRCALLSLYLTDSGPMVRAGCFWDSLDAFEARCEQTHGDNDHGKEYGFAVLLMRAHAELWTPALGEQA
jgi:hypothetical protein